MEVKQIVCHRCGMSRADLHFRLRLPEDLKKQIEEAAESNHRSMTAEIVSRLEDSFNPLRGLEDPEVNRQTERFISLMAQIGREAAKSDRVFFIGSRRIGDDPEADAADGLTADDLVEARRKRGELDPNA